MNRTAATISILAATTLVITAGLSVAGPLDPPAGPIAGTYKTLTEVQPRIAISATNTPGDADSLYRISQPGSYYLTGNILGVAGKKGIEIDSSGVTLDLNGFELQGVAGALDGISVAGFRTSVAVTGGSVREWPGDGVDLNNATNTLLSQVRSSNNTAAGFRTGSGAVVRDCTSLLNGSYGFETSTQATISGCNAQQNTAAGFHLSIGAVITDCSAYANHGDGIRLSSNSIARSNICTTNGLDPGDGAGIHATSSDNRIEGNNCTANDRGIDVDNGGNFITRNICSGNTVNWDVAVTNLILVVQAAPAPAVTGNSGGLAPGSTDPNANFTY